MKSSVPGSAQWRSSNTITTGLVAASRSNRVRQAPNSSSDRLGAPPTPSSASNAGSSQRRSSASGTCSTSVSVTRARVVASPSFSTSPHRPRTISPSAQNVSPPPWAGERPECHQTLSLNPSTYFRNSQARRLLPMPAGPRSDTRRTLRSRAEEWNRSLSSRNSVSRPTKGASSASDRLRPPTSATIRTARHAGTGACLPLSIWSPACSKVMAAADARRVVSPTRTVPGWATLCSREAVLTRSPATSP